MKYNYLIAYSWQLGSTPQIEREVMALEQPIAAPSDILVLEDSLRQRITPNILKQYSKPVMSTKDKTALDKMVKNELKVNVLIPTLLSTEDEEGLHVFVPVCSE